MCSCLYHVSQCVHVRVSVNWYLLTCVLVQVTPSPSLSEWCKVGLGICYDMRFPELALLYARQGCKMLCYPGAFNMTTGPAHWELLLKSRALDNQLFVAGVSVARDEDASYVAWGHSTVVDPW